MIKQHESGVKKKKNLALNIIKAAVMKKIRHRSKYPSMLAGHHHQERQKTRHRAWPFGTSTIEVTIIERKRLIIAYQ